MIKNVVITNGQLPSVLERDEGALDQHQPQLETPLPSPFENWRPRSDSPLCPETQSQDQKSCLEPVGHDSDHMRASIGGKQRSPSRHHIYLTSCLTGFVWPQCPFLVNQSDIALAPFSWRIILLYRYIITVSSDDLWRWLNLFEINL